MEILWWLTSILFVGVLSIYLFRACCVLEKYLATKISSLSKISDSLEKIAEEYLKREFARSDKDVESHEQSAKPGPSMEQPDRSKVEAGPSEEDLASIVSKKRTTAVSFGDEVDG